MARTARPTDEGFTLIEVVVSLVLLSIVSTGALYFFVNGTKAITHQQRSQNAVAVANEAMELAYSVGATTAKASGGGDEVNKLLSGRAQADVESAWATAAARGTEGLSDTYPVWDSSVALGTPVLPIEHDVTLSNMTYRATTLVGTCYRSTATLGADAPCSTISGVPADPGSVPLGFARLLRVMVVVTWEPTIGSCDGTSCVYQLSALIDPSRDVVWNNTTQPIAVDDTSMVGVGESVTIDVLANDILGPVTMNPVQKLLVKTGTGTVALTGSGDVLFTAPPNASGYMTFTYSLKDAQGRESNTATVRVAVMPKAVDDTVRTAKSDPILIPVTTNDLGTPASVTLVSPLAIGSTTAVASGTGILFDPQGHTGTYVFQYSFLDTSTLLSNAATVTVTVTEFRDPLSADYEVVVPVTASGSTQPLDMLNLTGNPADFLIVIESASITKGKLIVGSTDYSGTNTENVSISYAQQGNEPGIYTFLYRVKSPDGTITPVAKTITLKVAPVAMNDVFVVSPGSTTAFNLGSNDAPTNFGGSTQFSPSWTTPSCGSLPTTQNDKANGILTYVAPAAAGTCTFTYKITGVGALATLESSVATVTVTVKSTSVAPVANDDNLSVIRGKSGYLNVGINDVPTGGFTKIETRNLSCAGGTLTASKVDLTGGSVYFTAPGSSGTPCTFQYRVTGTGASAGESGWATATVTVRRN